MLEQVRELLRLRDFHSAVIVDDAFDDSPVAGEIEVGRWDRFFDDWQADDELLILDVYGKDKYQNTHPSDLRRDQDFVSTVWAARAQIPAASTLFEEFERQQQIKRDQLAPLVHLLETGLSLTCVTEGRTPSGRIADAQLVFLDLFLGFTDDEAAITRAIVRVREVVAQRPETPPSVVLLSASARIEELGPRLRDGAELLGCQFRMIRKSELSQEDFVASKIFDLVVSYQDGLRANSLILAWDAALSRAKATFLKSLRSLDLADYANVHSLILEAEEEPIGDYMLDLFELYLHYVLESQSELVRAAKKMNSISWSQYPPAQFMPSPEVVEMADGAMFHHQVRTDTESEIDGEPSRVKLGDVFLAPKPSIQLARTLANEQIRDGSVPDEAVVIAELPQARYAYVVISQSCDLQHGETDRLLLLRGDAKPYSWKEHGGKGVGPRTLVMKVGEDRYTIEWDLLAPETWLLKDMPSKARDGFRKVRQFRTPFALQLQQSFIGKLGRVGTLATLPARHTVGIKVFLRNRGGTAQELVALHHNSDVAVCLVGRTKKGATKEWLLLSDGFLKNLRQVLMQIEVDIFPIGTPTLATLRDEPEFYRKLSSGLIVNRASENGSKPISVSEFDVVQILTRPTFSAGAQIAQSYRALVIELDGEGLQ